MYCQSSYRRGDEFDTRSPYYEGFWDSVREEAIWDNFGKYHDDALEKLSDYYSEEELENWEDSSRMVEVVTDKADELAEEDDYSRYM